MSAGSPSDSELLRLELRTMFRFSLHGRIAAINEPPWLPGPRIFRATAGGITLVRIREDVPESIARHWLATEGEEQLRLAVAKHRPVEQEYRGPAFVLPKVSAPTGTEAVSSALRLHPELIARGWKAGETGPYIGVVRDGMVVAVCYSSRLSAEAAAAGVETVTAYRGQGLAVEAVKGWAAAVQSSGKIAFYSTEWTNEASRRVAAKLNAREFGEHWHLT
ncbi:MAG: GNAT family N-acetyltransferase [Dehalococcoidia bacterium]